MATCCPHSETFWTFNALICLVGWLRGSSVESFAPTVHKSIFLGLALPTHLQMHLPVGAAILLS